MRILYFSNSYPPYISGTAVFASSLAQNMVAAGHDVAVAVPSMYGRVGKFKSNHLTEYFLPSIPNPFRQFHTLFWISSAKTKAIIEEFKPDIIHYNDLVLWPFIIAPWARDKKILLVFTQHGMLDYVAYFLPLSKLFLPLLIHQWHKALNLFDLVTVPSVTMKRHLIQDVGSDKKLVKIISNGVDCQHFSGHKGLLKKNNSEKKTLKILYVGRFEIEKSLLVLLKAAALITQPFQLRLVGGGSQLKALEQTVCNLGLSKKVRFIKSLPEKKLVSEYHWADIFVMPSPMEAQSIVTLQAMACELPVVGADGGALPELILPIKTGWLFKADNVQDLAKKIQLAAQASVKTLKTMGLVARKHALKHESTQVYKTWHKSYQDLHAKSFK